MFFKNRTNWLIAGLVSGLLLCGYGFGLAMWTDQQVMFYNAGLRFYKQGDLEKAYKAFDLSAAVYKRGQNMTYWQRLIYPKPSAELASLAAFQKGKILIYAQQIPAAVEAFKESLMINPGNGYSRVTTDDAKRLFLQAYPVKYDLELLFKNNQDEAKKQGKGKPKQGQGSGKPVPGNDPSTMPGKGNRDDI